ncbi:formimidoylglutamase [Rufibacter soli]
MYKPSDKTTWKGRTDMQDGVLGLRWHQVVHFLDLSREVEEGHGNFVFLGFQCDEGIRRNQGRSGAAAGPTALRLAMSSFADHLPEDVVLYAGGDIICHNQMMEPAQIQLGKKVEMLLKKGYKPLVLGGGHETAYGHYLGIKKVLKTEEKLGIINFDAHFDLRSYATHPHSGSPFLQIADDLHVNDKEFHYLCLGIQESSNTRMLFQTAQELEADYVLAEDLQVGPSETVRAQVETFLAQVDKVYVTIDLDVFAAAYAPGVSAPSALGITPQIALPLLQQIIASGKLLTLDVVELNPSLDQDSRTAKLAAGLLYQVVKWWK